MARKRGLELDQVVAAAAAVADRDGIDGLTLAGVAATLDVRSPSLYSHVDGLAGLRRAVALDAARRLGAEMAAAIDHRRGEDALRAMAVAYRSFAKRHPGAYATINTVPSPDDDAEVYAVFAAQLPPIVAVLEDMGVERAEAVDVIRAVRSALHGFAALEAGAGFGLPDDVERSFTTMVDVLVAGIEGRVRPRRAARPRATGSKASPRRRP
jgi:AcrR family transcriptional regulator